MPTSVVTIVKNYFVFLPPDGFDAAPAKLVFLLTLFLVCTAEGSGAVVFVARRQCVLSDNSSHQWVVALQSPTTSFHIYTRRRPDRFSLWVQLSSRILFVISDNF